MVVTWFFWAALLAPGLALMTFIRPADERQGGLGMVAIAYVWSFALLSPISLLGYWLQWPLWSMSAAVLLSICAGIAILYVRRERWLPQARPPWGSILASVLLGGALYHAAAQGGHLTNDADFHLARVRWLFAHGLNNADPFVGTGFTHPYHTNLYHAVIASGSQLTGVDPLDFWYESLPWAKLVAAAGIAGLAFKLGGHALGAWFAAFAFLGSKILLDWILYPNQLGPFWLVSVGLTACVGLLTTKERRFHLVLLAATAFVLGQTHGLYGGYLGLLTACAVVVVLGVRTVRQPRTASQNFRLALLVAVAVSLSAPFLYVTRYARAPVQANFDYQGGDPSPRANKPGRWTKNLRVAKGSVRLPSSRLVHGWPARLGLALSLGLLLWRRRRETWCLLPGLVLVSACLLSPSLATGAARMLGAPWVLERALDITQVHLLAIAGAGLLLPLQAWPLATHATAPLAVVAWFLGIHVYPAGVPGDKLEEHYSYVRFPLPTAHSLPPSFAQERDLLQGTIPPGSTVLTHPLAARQIAKLHDLRFVRVSRNHSGVDDMLDRTHDMHALWAARSVEEIRPLLDKYGIVYGVQSERHKLRVLKKLPPIAEAGVLQVVRLDSSVSSAGRDRPENEP